MKKPFDLDKSVAGAIKRFPLTLARLEEADRVSCGGFGPTGVIRGVTHPNREMHPTRWASNQPARKMMDD